MRPFKVCFVNYICCTRLWFCNICVYCIHFLSILFMRFIYLAIIKESLSGDAFIHVEPVAPCLLWFWVRFIPYNISNLVLLVLFMQNRLCSSIILRLWYDDDVSNIFMRVYTSDKTHISNIYSPIYIRSNDRFNFKGRRWLRAAHLIYEHK